MNDRKCQQIVFTYDQFGDKLWCSVAKQLDLLLQSDHVAVVRKDETGIIVIEFEHDNRWDNFGVPNPVWITEDDEFALNAAEDI